MLYNVLKICIYSHSRGGKTAGTSFMVFSSASDPEDTPRFFSASLFTLYGSVEIIPTFANFSPFYPLLLNTVLYVESGWIWRFYLWENLIVSLQLFHRFIYHGYVMPFQLRWTLRVVCWIFFIIHWSYGNSFLVPFNRFDSLIPNDPLT